MGVKVRIVPDGRYLEAEPGVRALDLLKLAGMNSESGVVLVNGRPVTEDYRIREDDEVTVVRVLSGG
ncbi:MAG: MoaD/ThiS family protein [Desulfurococcales archaeon]|nr:MoaD/ThiS family protein [Desulfurococcales archaeon]MCE4605001.1 MoaD/ThiS family protein [Desulfurococcales archaeon]